MFERLKYSVRQTPYSNDVGLDAIITKDGDKFLVECKRYSESNKSGRPEIQKFHSAIVNDRAKGGFFVTTGNFSTSARKYAAKHNIELVDADELVKMMYATLLPTRPAHGRRPVRFSGRCPTNYLPLSHSRRGPVTVSRRSYQTKGVCEKTNTRHQ